MKDFIIYASCDFIEYDKNDTASSDTAFQRYLNSKNVPVSVDKLEDHFFNQQLGSGDVYLFEVSRKEFVFFNLYRSIDDQCDVILIAARISEMGCGIGTKALRSLYDNADFQVSYMEAQGLSELDSLVDPSNYPRDIWGYHQKIIINSQEFK